MLQAIKKIKNETLGQDRKEFLDVKPKKAICDVCCKRKISQ